MKNDLMPVIDNYKEGGFDFIRISNNVGLTVTFSSLGAAIHSIKYLGEEMTFQTDNIEEFTKDYFYNGKAIGRVAGRIPNGEINLGKKVIKIKPNEGKNVLHGGKEGISNKEFSIRSFATSEHIHVVYTYFSNADEGGFPGYALFEVHYILHNNEPKLKIKLLSYVTEKCPISMTLHTYFSLGEENIDNMKMQINASKYVDIDPKDLLLKSVKPVPSYLDFRKPKFLMKDMNAKEMNQGMLHGYDHCFVLDEINESLPQISLENDKYKVEFFTDFDSAVVYTNNDTPDGIRRGVAVEPQLNPTGNRFLSRKQEFDHHITYYFTKK